MSGPTPLVSCLCLTFGRPQILREAIWCFLQQDYPNKELIVVNDHAHPLDLDRDYPGVQIVNVGQRFANLGQKRNYTTRLARGDILCVWDDDDLFLPWRLSETVRHLQANPDKWAFKPTRAWTSTHNQNYRLARNLFHSQLGMTRECFDQTGGYADMNSGQDIVFEKLIPPARFLRYQAPVSELVYVYRWGNTHHISGHGMDKPGKRSGYDILGERVQNVPGGTIVPGFDHDYWQDLLGDAASSPDVDPAELERLTRRLAPYHQPGAQ